MSRAHDVLGIEAGASLLEIKRAYGRLLRGNRPEDDAKAFQRLHEAYLACLDHRRRLDAGQLVVAAEDCDDEWDADDPIDATSAEEPAPAPGEAPVDVDGQLDPVWWQGFEAQMRRAQDLVEFAPRPPSSPDASTVLAEMFEVALRDDQGMAAWLRANQPLYGLALKDEVGGLMLEQLVMQQDELSWRAIDAMFNFFEFDSVSDPRFRDRPRARQLWQRIRGDERFQRHLLRQRQLSYGTTFFDGFVDRELFGPPDRWRRRAIQWLPLLAPMLRQKVQLLREVDRERADRSLSASARAFWLPMMETDRLHWRRIVPSLLQIAVALGLLVGLASLGSTTPAIERLRYAAIGFAICAGIYLVIVGARFALGNYASWRLKRWGGGDVPAGSNILADPPSTIALLVAAASLAIALGVARWANDPSGSGIALYLIAMTSLRRFRAGPRWRWEETVFLLSASALYWPALGWWPAPRAQTESWEFRLVVATSLATCSLVLFDYLYSLARGRSLADVRESLGVHLLVGAVLALVVAFLA